MFETLAHTTIREETAMFDRTSFAIVAAVGALFVAAPASADDWGADRYDEGRVTAILDACEQALVAKQVAPASPDYSLREPVADDWFRIHATDTAAPISVSSGGEIAWPQIGVGLAFAFLLGFGVMLAMRLPKFRLR